MTTKEEEKEEYALKLEQTKKELDSTKKELKTFAYIISHDLKAPLRAISQLSDWIYKDYADTFDKNGKEMMELLNNRVKRMEGLIDGVLQYSRAGRTFDKIEKVNLDSVVREVVQNLSPPENIKVTIKGSFPTVNAESNKIKQLFENLISNSINFMDKEKGEIKVECDEEELHWKFSVSDNGPGIDPKFHEKVFKVFQTLQSKDVVETIGIGLPVAKKIVEHMGGQIGINSSAGKGCTVYFTIPKKDKI